MEDKKEYQLVTSVNEGILEIIITGEVPMSAVDKLLNEVNAVGKAMNVGAELVDVRYAKGRFGFAESYFHVRDYPADSPIMKIAVVDLAENSDLQSFQETTAKNAGLSLKWFTDIDAARTWLKSK
ncbi:MAG: hypothetical protein ABSC53_07795 [Bacteroidota bacterium]